MTQGCLKEVLSQLQRVFSIRFQWGFKGAARVFEDAYGCILKGQIWFKGSSRIRQEESLML